jgi:acyl-CoA thioester hydrolase
MNIEEFKHKTKIKVRFSDLDAMQHVNNATYLSYLEEARIDYFDNLFKRDKGSLDFQAVVGRIEINYIYPIELGDEVEIYSRVSKLGTKSIDVEHIVAICKDNKFINAATALTKLVYYNYKTKTTMVIPDAERAVLVNFEGLTT